MSETTETDLKIKLPSGDVGTGSPRGGSYWGQWGGCPQQNILDKIAEHQALSVNGVVLGEAKLHEAVCGSYFHAMMYHYYTNELAQVVFDLDSDSENLSYEEATRLFREYRKHYPPFEFSTIKKEVPFALIDFAADPYDSEPVQEWVGKNEAVATTHIGSVMKTFGVPCITGQLDGVVTIANQKDLTYTETLRDVTLRGTGTYLFDTKTMTSHKSSVVTEMSEKQQFWLYCWAYEIITGVKPEGMIVNCVVRHNAEKTRKDQEKRGEEPTGLHEKSIFTIFVPYPTDEQKEILTSNLAAKYKKRELTRDNVLPLVNTGWCWRFGRACQHLENKVCDRVARFER